MEEEKNLEESAVREAMSSMRINLASLEVVDQAA